MAKEQTRHGSPRRKPLLIGIGIVVLFAVGVAVVLWSGGADGTEGSLLGRGEPSSVEVAPPIPAFRFASGRRVLVPTSLGPIKARERAAGRQAATSAAALLTDLYTEGFLDPANWQEGRYDDAFRIFAREAERQARTRADVLTAGSSAGDLFDEILPVAGRLSTRVLLDRAGKPALMVSDVSFRARATGSENEILRSTGQFVFEHVDGRWRVVSFRVTRNDEPGSAS